MNQRELPPFWTRSQLHATVFNARYLVVGVFLCPSSSNSSRCVPFWCTSSVSSTFCTLYLCCFVSLLQHLLLFLSFLLRSTYLLYVLLYLLCLLQCSTRLRGFLRFLLLLWLLLLFLDLDPLLLYAMTNGDFNKSWSGDSDSDSGSLYDYSEDCNAGPNELNRSCIVISSLASLPIELLGNLTWASCKRLLSTPKGKTIIHEYGQNCTPPPLPFANLRWSIADPIYLCK